METLLRLCVPAIWAIFGLVWFISSRNQKSARVAEPFATRLFRHWLPLLTAIYLVAAPGELFGRSWLREAFLPHTIPVYLTGLAVMLAGLALAIWARRTLGRNWSANVQIKQNHELITNGPYRHIRHPIYAALILMFAGNAIVVGDVRGILAVLIITLSFWFKYRQEERFMLQEFGERYASYRERTAPLFPGLK